MYLQALEAKTMQQFGTVYVKQLPSDWIGISIMIYLNDLTLLTLTHFP